MNRTLVLSFLGALLIAAPPGQHTYAAPARLAAARPSAATPSGQELLRRMQTAVQRAGSFHFSASFLVDIPGLSRVTVRMVGDESTRQKAAHAVSVSHSSNASAGLSGAAAQRMEVVVVGRTSAVRTGGAAWRCQKAAGALPSILKALPGSVQIQTAQTVKSVIVAGVPAWRVRARSRMSVSGISVVGPATYDIAQRDFTLLRTTATGTLRTSAATLRERDSIVFSRYGESVQVQLPAACKT